MARKQFTPTSMGTGVTVRYDTASDTDTPATTATTLTGVQLASHTPGGWMAKGDLLTGALDPFLGPDGASTLYQKKIDARGNVIGSPTTLTGVALADPAPDPTGGAPTNLDTFDELAAGIGDDPNFAVTMATALAKRMITVDHGSTAGTARPTSTTPVLWIGTVDPTNKVTRDIVFREDLPAFKRWNGSAWIQSGLDSPAFINNPTAPTQSPGDSSTKLATTAFVEQRAGTLRALHKKTAPAAALPEQVGQKIICGIDAASTRIWSFDSSGLYQQDSLAFSLVNWNSKTLPTNCTTTGTGVTTKIVVFNNLMYGCFYNTTTARQEIHSSPLVSGSTQPTWTLRHTLTANARLIMQAFRATSVGLYIGEYTFSAVGELASGPTIWLSTDGLTFSAALGPIANCRHVHGVYEDPYNLGTVYITVGDASPNTHWCYSSTTGAAGSFTAITSLDAGTSAWQAVSMGFTSDYVWFFSDQASAYGLFVMDRTAKVPKWATTKSKWTQLAVPGGRPGRVITDGVFTNGSATMTSATANFTSDDVGKRIEGVRFVPHDTTYIVLVGSSTSVTLNNTANQTVSNRTLTILGDTFYTSGYSGIVNTDGVAYLVVNDSSVGGTCGGIFALSNIDQPWALQHALYNVGTVMSNYEAFTDGSNLWVASFGPFPLFDTT